MDEADGPPIQRLHKPSYSDFLPFQKRNVPVIISGLMEEWEAAKAWVTSDGKPDFDYLKEQYGSATVPVINCSGSSKERSYGSEQKFEMRFEEYLSKWEQRILGPLYLKDWHFKKSFKNAVIYETPKIFEDDWLNEWWDRLATDDYRFVYMGPEGTFTPLHHDVMYSNSWSANICGTKKWILFSPEESKKLYDRNQRDIPSDITNVSPEDMKKFPNIADVRGIEIIQEAREIIFVPSGWHHQVWNMEDTISVNHNWFNAENLGQIWRFLASECMAVREAIGYCRECFESQDPLPKPWERHCELILRANTAINMSEFYQLLMEKKEELKGQLQGSMVKVLKIVKARRLERALRQILEVLREVAPPYLDHIYYGEKGFLSAKDIDEGISEIEEVLYRAEALRGKIEEHE